MNWLPIPLLLGSIVGCSSPAEPAPCVAPPGRPSAVRVLNCTEAQIVVLTMEDDAWHGHLIGEYLLRSFDPVGPGEAVEVAPREVTGDYQAGDGIEVVVYKVRGDGRARYSGFVHLTAEELRRKRYRVVITKSMMQR